MRYNQEIFSSKKSEKFKLFRYIFLLFLILLFFSVLDSIKKVRNAKRQVDQAQERLENLLKEQQSLREEISKIETQEFIEKQLRDRLGLVREGEIVIVLPDPQVVKKFAPRYDSGSSSNLESSKRSFWQRIFSDKKGVEN